MGLLLKLRICPVDLGVYEGFSVAVLLRDVLSNDDIVDEDVRGRREETLHATRRVALLDDVVGGKETGVVGEDEEVNDVVSEVVVPTAG